jgi:hypothetical protein
MTTLSIDTPETQEAVERWRQGKINIFDEMARLERERDEARKESEEQARLLGMSAEREESLRGKLFMLERELAKLKEGKH